MCVRAVAPSSHRSVRLLRLAFGAPMTFPHGPLEARRTRCRTDLRRAATAARPTSGGARGRRARRCSPRHRRDPLQSRAGCRDAPGSWLSPCELVQGTARGGDQAATGGAGTGVRRRPRRSSQSARTRMRRPCPARQSRAGAPRSVRCRSSMTQHGLPSGSASTTRATSCCPMSRCRAPSPSSRSTSWVWPAPPKRSRWSLGISDGGSGTRWKQVQHRSSLDAEPRLEAIRLIRQPLAAKHRVPEPA